MKHTIIIKMSDRTLIEAFSSEVTWLPLFVGDIVRNGGREYTVKERIFNIQDDRLEIRVA